MIRYLKTEDPEKGKSENTKLQGNYLGIFDAGADGPRCAGLDLRVLIFEEWPQQPHAVQPVNDTGN